uniref:Reverse transcriptase domain-containing protein n=1 Tax=Tanacetum cinerariifolium TaxID=118510 RepID=A0A6L2NC20_TANCI|nr:reverse transcriptase domain-containing protein [Tanacetum cinerariifolium]
MSKYGVTHRLATAYHPQTSRQVEVSNHGLKRILERTIGENRASWSEKLEDALRAFSTAYKTPIGCTPYKLVYGKSCHLPIEIEHKAYWALKHVNFDIKTVGDHRKLQLNELNELRDQAYENSLIYKEKTKKLHDSKIKNRIFNVGDRVLLFNSRLKIFSGKLKSRWPGPFTITKYFPYRTIELSQPEGPNFKVNGHRVKHYFGGDVPQLSLRVYGEKDWSIFVLKSLWVYDMNGTDIAKITRKKPKPDKNGHEKGKSTQKPGFYHQKSTRVNLGQLILLHLAGSQPMLKSSYKAEDGVIISIPSLVGGVADVVVEIKGTDYFDLVFSVGCQKPGRLADKAGTFREESFPQQYPCFEDCGVLPEADHCQPPRYTVNQPTFNVHNDIFTSQTTLMEQMTQLTSMCEMACQIIQNKQEEKRIEEEQAAKAQNSKIPACYDDDDDYNSAITPNEPVDSLMMGNEHLDTILAMETDEFIKSCVENLVPNPNPHHFDAESDLIESMLNRDSSIISSSSKIDSLLDEFTGELTLLKSIPPGIDETDCHPENEIHLIERLLYDNSSPRPPEEFVSKNSDADIKSFSPSPIPDEDSDSRMEEIDLTFTLDDPMPPSIKDDDNDSERDILIHEELPSNYSLSLLEIESFYFDILSFSRPPAKPPDGNKGILNIKMMGDNSEQKVPIPKLTITCKMMGDNSEQKVPIPKLTITRVPNQEKSPDLLSRQGFENFQPSAKYPMMIHGKNIPILDVPLFHFYPPRSTLVWGELSQAN